MTQRRCGFTLVEIMVVVAATLLLMGMMLTIFRAGTQTVKTVELKLELYSAARNVLDGLELNVQQALMNEKGEMFCLKSASWQDTDPMTPDGTQLYRQSRRNADSVSLVRNVLHGSIYNEVGLSLTSLLWPGVQSDVPPESGGADVWRTTIQPNLQYQFPSDRNYLLKDVSLLQFGLISDTRKGHDDGGDRFPPPKFSYNEGVHFLAPGNERFEDWQVATNSISAMDLDIAYWDDATQKFIDPPDNTAIYFAPMPKALRFTITVCDHNKRDRVTLSRVVWLPVGMGSGGLETAPSTGDDKIFDTGIQPYNRLKNMKAIDPALHTPGTTKPW